MIAKNRKIVCTLGVIFFLILLYFVFVYKDYSNIHEVNTSELDFSTQFKCNIDEVKELDHNHLCITGWAIKEKENIERIECYIALKNKNTKKVYKIKTRRIDRPDVTEFYNDGFNYNGSGFAAVLDKQKFEKGSYEIVIIYRNNQNNILGLANKDIIISS